MRLLKQLTLPTSYQHNYIYLIREREFIRLGENILKIGKSTQANTKRIRSYPKGSQLLILLSCKNCHKAEKDLLNIFDKTFTHRPEYGREYYEGDEGEMKRIIYEFITFGKYKTLEEPKTIISKKKNFTNYFSFFGIF